MVRMVSTMVSTIQGKPVEKGIFRRKLLSLRWFFAWIYQDLKLWKPAKYISPKLAINTALWFEKDFEKNTFG